MHDGIEPELELALRRLELGKLLDTLPERLQLATQKGLSHQDLLLTVLTDEVERREGNAVAMRAEKARLDPDMRLERWDATAAVTFDRALWAELATARFVAAHRHVAIVGPVGVGKTFLAHAFGHIVCRKGHSVLAVTADRRSGRSSTRARLRLTSPSYAACWRPIC